MADAPVLKEKEVEEQVTVEDQVEETEKKPEEKPAEDAPAAEPEEIKMTRGEKKARKMLTKAGLKPVPNVSRITVKKSKDVIFAYNKPDVYKNPHTGTYVIFGQPKIEDLAMRAAQSLQEQQAAAEAGKEGEEAKEPAKEEPKVEEEKKVEGEAPEKPKFEELDEEGLSAEDIEFVMKNADVDRPKAIAALKKNSGDLVNAIMELST